MTPVHILSGEPLKAWSWGDKGIWLEVAPLGLIKYADVDVFKYISFHSLGDLRPRILTEPTVRLPPCIPVMSPTS
jgi:hypothetical protein